MSKLHYRVRVRGHHATIEWSRGLSHQEHAQLSNPHISMLSNTMDGWSQCTSICNLTHMLSRTFCAPVVGRGLHCEAPYTNHAEAIKRARIKLSAWLTISRRLGIDTIFD